MRRFLTVVVAALAFPLAAQNADPVLDQARGLINSNQAAKAAEILEKEVAAKPNDAQRHYWLGNAYGVIAQQSGMLKAASMAGKVRDEFAKAVQLDPNFVEARMGLMEFYLRAPGFMGGDDAKAREQAAEVRKRDAFNGHRAFATLALTKNDAAAARNEYIALVRENPSSAKAHYYYALFLMLNDKNYKGAGDELDAALRADQNYVAATFQIGHLSALSSSNFPRGEEALQKYLTVKPSNDDPPIHRAHYWLGVIYEKQGKRKEAKAQFETSLRAREDQKDVKEALKRVS